MNTIIYDVISEIDSMKSSVQYLESNIESIKTDMTQKEFKDFVSTLDSLKFQIVDTDRELNKVINSLPQIYKERLIGGNENE